MHKRLISRIGTSAILLLSACGEATDHASYGSVEVTTSSPTIEKELTTSDGWTVKYDRFLVSVPSIEVASSESGVVTAVATAQIFDAVVPPPKSLLAADVRYARPWDAFGFRVGPALASEDSPITLAPSVKDADRDAMTKGGLSLYVEAKATKAGVTKTLKWGFTTDTSFTECAGELGGAQVKGVVIPANGKDTVDLVFRGDVLFSDDLGKPGETVRFDALAAADADGNGEITLEELTATTLDTARAGGAPYATADEKDVADLGTFTASLTRRILGSFRAKGTCAAAPAEVASP